MDLGAALLALLVGFVVKPAVMVLAAVLVVRVHRALRPGSRRRSLLLPAADVPEVRLMGWGLVLFLASELLCGVEVYVLLQANLVLSCLHGLVSATGMALFSVGLLGFLDRRLLRFGGSGCLGHRLCRSCSVATRAGCQYRPLLVLAGALLLAAALPPLFAPTAERIADTGRYVLPWPGLNAWFDGTVVPFLRTLDPGYTPSGEAYRMRSEELVLEYRVLPVLALLLLGAGTGLAHLRRETLGLRLLAAGAGVLAYCYLEVICYAVIGEVLLGSLAHELVELWFLVATAELLGRTFSPPRSPPGHETFGGSSQP